MFKPRASSLYPLVFVPGQPACEAIFSTLRTLYKDLNRSPEPRVRRAAGESDLAHVGGFTTGTSATASMMQYGSIAERGSMRIIETSGFLQQIPGRTRI